MQKAVRLERELQRLVKKPPTGISCSRSGDSVEKFEACIAGPENSPFSGGVFILDIAIPDNYPFAPPNVTFRTPVYHPNIDSTGRICLDLLKMPPMGSWKPIISLENLLVAIRSLLEFPNPHDPLEHDIAAEYLTDKLQFEEKAKLHTRKHAMQLTSR